MEIEKNDLNPSPRDITPEELSKWGLDEVVYLRTMSGSEMNALLERLGYQADPEEGPLHGLFDAEGDIMLVTDTLSSVFEFTEDMRLDILYLH